MSAQNQNNTLIISNALTALVAVLGSYFALQGSNQSDQTTQLNNAYSRIAQLEKNDKENNQAMDALRGKFVEQSYEIISLRAQLSESVNRTELLQSFLDYLPFPAWIKEYCVEGQPLVMVMINDSYTAEYKITQANYIGRTDFDVHPYDIAMKYQDADLAVISANQSVSTVEPVIIDGITYDLHVFKFPVSIPNNQCQGVGGAAIRINSD